MPTSPEPYLERLRPSLGWWVSAALVGACLGLVLAPVAGRPGFVAGALVGAALTTGALVLTTATVEVSGHELRAGRARIDLAHVGSVELLDAAGMSALRGPRADARAYLCQRGWLPLGVRVEVVDPADPTPYWLLSSRRPRRLAETIEAHR